MKAEKLSILSALAASSCCILPLAFLGLSLIGLGTASMAGVSTFIGSLKWYLVGVAVVGQGVSYALYFRERRRCAADSCGPEKTRTTRNILLVSSTAMLAFLGWMSYGLIFPAEAATEAGTANAAVEPGASAAVAVFDVTGMTCAGCEFAIAESIRGEEGVDSARANYLGATATVWFDDNVQTTDQFAAAMARVGYTTELIMLTSRSE
jgi:copper chaperone CopZ